PASAGARNGRREPSRPQHAPTAERTRRASLERVMAQARSRLTRAATLYADGELDREGYELLRDQARADLDGATAELETLTPAPATLPTLPPLAVVLRELGQWDAILAAA